MLRKYVNKDSLLGESDFNWRGGEVSRLESLMDGVFAIAVTLLIVSVEVPRNFSEFVDAMWGFPGFAITFAFLFMIWYAHYLFHRRYGLEDYQTMLLNCVLIFLILFYIFPLKFLATVLIGELFLNNLLGLQVNFDFDSNFIDMRTIMVVYGVGLSMIWGVLTLLYRHAYNHRLLLELNHTETQTTKETILVYGVLSAFGLMSVTLACLLPLHLVGISGWVYCFIGPAIFIALKVSRI